MSQNRPQYTFGELVKVVQELIEDFQKHKQMVYCHLNNKVDKPGKEILDHGEILLLSEKKSLNTPNFNVTKEKIDIQRDLIKIEKDLLEFHEEKTDTEKTNDDQRKSNKCKRKVENQKQNRNQKIKAAVPTVQVQEAEAVDPPVKLEPKLEICEEENLPELKNHHIELSGSRKNKKNIQTNVSTPKPETRKRPRRRKKPSDFSVSNNESDTASEEELGPKEKVKKKDQKKKEEKLWCKCQSAASDEMIQCDHCDQWFHFPCVGIPEEFTSIASWYCEDCFLSLNEGSVELCICDEWYEADHELVRCRNPACLKFCHPSCLNLDSEEEVTHWEEAGGLCGHCADSKPVRIKKDIC